MKTMNGCRFCALSRFLLTSCAPVSRWRDQRLMNRVVYYSTENQRAKPLRHRKPTAMGYKTNHFVDWCRVKVTGGSGGDGQSTLSQLWCNPTAGPDGGDGGNGGHVIFEACSQTHSLDHVMSEYVGAPGEKGGTKDCTGKSAEHTIIKVPLGTVFKSEKSGTLLADLCEHGEMFIAARGGAGGKGNHYFLTNDNRAPLVAEYGAHGEEFTYTLELKTIAHAGLIGFPNAGKSTLLRAISRARPKVAAYPFTTLNPHIGMVHYDDFVQIAVADIPGLIPRAHENRGLGISFLRHIERCLCLIYVIDLSVPEPWNQLASLKYELEKYKPGLSSRPNAVLGNKYDLPESKSNFEKLKSEINLPVIAISSKFGTNVLDLLQHLRKIYDQESEVRKLYHGS